MQKLLRFFIFVFLFTVSGFASDTPSKSKTVESPAQAIPEQAPATPVPSSGIETPPIPSVNYEHAFFKMIATLIGLLLLIFLTVWLLRRLSQGRLGLANSSRTIKIIEKRALSPKSMLYLIEIGGQRVVIAESQLEVRAITSVENLVEDQKD